MTVSCGVLPHSDPHHEAVVHGVAGGHSVRMVVTWTSARPETGEDFVVEGLVVAHTVYPDGRRVPIYDHQTERRSDGSLWFREPPQKGEEYARLVAQSGEEVPRDA